jgi:hypothetical protein
LQEGVGCGLASFNIIAAARFTPENADARITEAIASLWDTGRPFSWWVRPVSAYVAWNLKL